MGSLWIMAPLVIVCGLASGQGMNDDSSRDPGLLPSGDRLVMVNDLEAITRSEAMTRCKLNFGGTLYNISSMAALEALEKYLAPQNSEREVGRYYRTDLWTAGTTSENRNTVIYPDQNITEGPQCIAVDNSNYHYYPNRYDHMSLTSRPCDQRRGYICVIPAEKLDCASPLQIADLPATAFSTSAAGSAPQNISLYGNSAWQTNEYHKQWLVIDLGNVTTISGLVTRGTDTNGGAWISHYRLAYSMDQWDWTIYTANDVIVEFLGNSNPQHTKTHMLSKQIKARYVALLPQRYYRRIAVRLELYGCPSDEKPTATLVDYDITTNQVWSLSFSPYIISRNVMIGSGGSLTIGAGVKVLFTIKEAGITVKGGCLYTEGVSALMTVFKPGTLQATLDGIGSWKGIEFQSMACQNATLAGLRIEGALDAIVSKAGNLNVIGSKFLNNRNAVKVESTSLGRLVSIAGSEFRGNTQNALWSTLESDLAISKSNFHENSVAILLERNINSEGGRVNVTLTDVTVNSTKITGLKTFPRNTDITLKGCVFTHNKGKSIDVDVRDPVSTTSLVKILSSTFKDNEAYSDAISIMARTEANMTFEFKDSVMENNIYGLMLNCYTGMDVMVDNITVTGQQRRGLFMYKYQGCNGIMTVQGSRFHSNEAALSVDEASAQLDPLKLIIENNSFRNNSKQAVISVDISGKENYIEITKNVFVNNTARTTVYLELGDVTKESVLVTHNVFENHDAIEVSISALWEPGMEIDARHNWWGTVDLTAITAKLSDFYQRVRWVPAIINPIQSSSVTAFQDGDISLDRSFAISEEGVGGKLTGDVTIPSGSKMRVWSSIHIPPGMTLYIGEGAVLNFTLTTGILVEGNLVMSKDVVLRPEGRGYWGGLIYHNTAGQSIKGVNIISANDCIRLVKSSLEIDSTAIDKCGTGIYHSAADKSSLLISRSSITRCRSKGIWVYGTGIDKHSITIDLDQVNVSGNSMNQIYIDSYTLAVDVSIRGSYVNNTGAGNVGVMMILQKGQVSMENNTLESSDGNFELVNIRLEMSGDNTTLTLSENKFLHGGRRRMLTIQPRRLTGSPLLTLIDNEFIQPSGYNYDYGIYIDAGYNTIPYTVLIRGNHFECRSSPTCVYINGFRGNMTIIGNEFKSSRKPLDLRLGQSSNVSLVDNNFRNNSQTCFQLRNSYPPEVNITNNTFSENQGDAVLYLTSMYVIATGNYFDNPLATYDLKVSGGSTSGLTIQATRNWWGSAEYSDVIKRLYDHRRDSNLVKVIFEPFLTSKNRNTQPNTSRPQFFLSAVQIGGTLQEDITLRYTGTPYQVVRDIIVPPGRTLTLEPRAELHFSLGSMLVQGRLKSMGERYRPVILKPAEEGSWKGVQMKEAHTGMYRLSAGNTSHSGRVEVWRSVTRSGGQNTGRFLPVCMAYWNELDAHETCKQLGYTKALTWKVVNSESPLFKKVDTADRPDDGGCLGWDLKEQTCSWSQIRSCYWQATVNCDPSDYISPSADYMRLRSELRWTHIVEPTEGVTITGRPPILYGVNITGSQAGGLTFDGYLSTQLRIEYSQVSGSTGSGITFEFTNGNGVQYNTDSTPVYSEVYMRYCEVFNNSQNGIHYNQGSPNLTILETDIYDNANTGLYISQKPASLFLMRGCKVKENTRGFEIFSTYSVVLDDNTFSNCSGTGQLYKVQAGTLASVVIKGNRFIDHASRYPPVTMVQLYTLSQETYKVEVFNNTFRDNVVSQVMVMQGRSDGCMACNVTQNTFTNNTAFPGKQAEILRLYIPDITIHRNVFNNSVECELLTSYRGIDDKHDLTVSAPYNYWGVKTYEEVFKKTCSFFKDFALLGLNIWPFYSDVTLRELVNPPSSGQFIGSDGIGGDVTGHTIIRSRSLHYTVARSIYVRSGGKLTIEAGVTLQFKKNRGIISEGTLCFKERRGDTILLTAEDPRYPWYGIVLYLPIGEDCECCRLSNVVMEHMSKDALQVFGSGQLTMHGVTIRNFGGNAVEMMNEDVKLTITDSSFYNGASDKGINFNEFGKMVVKRSSFSNIRGRAVFMSNNDASQTNLTIEECTFNQTSGVYLASVANANISHSVFTHSQSNDVNMLLPHSSTVNIRYNRFFGTLYGESVLMNVAGTGTTVNVEFNSWSENMYEGLEVYARNIAQGNALSVLSNVFANSTRSAMVLKYVDDVDISLKNNTFYNNTYATGCAGVHVSFDEYQSEAQLTMELNDFYENAGTTIVQIDSRLVSEGSSYVKIFGNLFTDNSATEAVLQSQTYRATVEKNIFVNPLSLYDVQVTFVAGDFALMCPRNWWGTADEALIPNRILDNADDEEIGNVTWTDPLTSPEISCHNVNNCSGRGSCRRPDVCVCEEGWKGEDCNTVSCSLLYDCQGNGDCVGPNQCRCRSGWLPPDCSKPTCYSRYDCYNHGVCVAPNKCYCYEGFVGENCDKCAEGYWGKNCQACPECVNGFCNPDSGVCVCSGSNWAGDLCSECAEKNYGSMCQPHTKVLFVTPARGPDTGGTLIHVFGHNFPRSSQYRCRFSEGEVPGEWKSDEEIVCRTLESNAGRVRVSVSAGPGLPFTIAKVYFDYYTLCPEGACGSNEDPARGVCSKGRCVCVKPWRGDGCSEIGLPPVISPVSDQRVAEGNDLSLQLHLAEGDLPVMWRLSGNPLGMTVDAEGMLSWPSVVSSSQPYSVTVTCLNPYGKAQITFKLHVALSYHAVLDYVSPGPYPKASPLLISGRVVYDIDTKELQKSSVPVVISIQSNKAVRTLHVMSVPDTGVFYNRFFPSSREYGRFQADARHPHDSRFKPQTEWSVLGMRLSPSQIHLSGLWGKSLSTTMKLTNVGERSVLNVIAQQIQGMSIIEILIAESNSSAPPCVLNGGNCPLRKQLGASEELGLTLIIRETSLHPIRNATGGRFSIFLSTHEGVSEQCHVDFDFKIRRPLLKVNPGQITASLVRGSYHIITAKVENSGLLPATGVHINLPSDPMFSVISFGMASRATAEDENVVLQPGDEAELVLGLNPGPQRHLESLSGEIGIRSSETWIDLEYRFVITSNRMLDFVVHVEDEYTYFAEDKPLLEGARVRLQNAFGNEMWERYTNASGVAVFENIKENYYNLYSSADRHTGDSRVVYARPLSNTATVFLQRTAVTYSWTVKPVTFGDRYEITLEADFVTEVPIPVVTVEPKEVDLAVLERGLMPIINFKLTNHGLIRANKVYFKLPLDLSHPYISFSMDEEPIGDLAANSSIHVPVTVTLDKEKQAAYVARHSGSGGGRGKRSILPCISLAIYTGFSYLCDRERTVETDIAIWDVVQRECGGRGSRRRYPMFGGGGPVGHQGIGGPPGCCGGWNWRPKPSVTQPMSCENCLPIIWSCGTLPLSPAVGCFVGTAAGVATKDAWGTAESILGCFFPAASIFGCYHSLMKCTKPDETGCAESAVVKCITPNLKDPVTLLPLSPMCTTMKLTECLSGMPSGLRMKRQTLLTQMDVMPEVRKRIIVSSVYLQKALLVAGDPRWAEVQSPEWWNAVVIPAISDTSEGGSYISQSEMSTILQYPAPNGTDKDMINSFISRLNRTQWSWDHGVLEGPDIISHSDFFKLNQLIQIAESSAHQDGFASPGEWLGEAITKFNKAEKKEEGVCAKVRIQIKQRAVITREAFEATLELENGEISKLTNIKVDIYIKDQESQEIATEKFAIVISELTELTNVDGLGQLGVGKKGIAKWLIVPYAEAASNNAVEYAIGGTLIYSIDGNEISVPLFPDTVTVKPDPRLHLNYFLEKYVQSDNPFTIDIEPAIPFSLGILISNTGYGTANQLQITSGQPTIIENEKGLLITFELLSSQLGAELLLPSLTINFGDIEPFTTKVARWMMTSSLRGTFSNYSATFQNINPLGDPQLSIMESVTFHELSHVVRVDKPWDDGLPDFLTVDTAGLQGLPNQVYRSDNGLEPLPVSVSNITSLQTLSTTNIRVFVTPQHGVGWNYMFYKYDTDLPRTVGGALRQDGRQLIPEYNVWVSEINKQYYVHIFDKFESEEEHDYDISFVEANFDRPQFAEDTYLIEISESTPAPIDILTLSATDADRDIIAYKLADDIDGLFSLGQVTGTLRLRSKVDREDTASYSLIVLGIDNGLPPRTGTAVVNIRISDVNDNAPDVISDVSEVTLESSTPIGYAVFEIRVIDQDIGYNGAVVVDLSASNSLFQMTYEANQYVIRTIKPLTAGRLKNTLTVTASDGASPSLATMAFFTVYVVATNAHVPQFEVASYLMLVAENEPIGTNVGNVGAVDADLGSVVTYAMQTSAVPFRMVGDTIVVAGSLDRETVEQYTLSIIATDNGMPPTGRKSSSVTVTIGIIDVNDVTPSFPRDSYQITVLENVQYNTQLLKLAATDKDIGPAGEIMSYHLDGSPDGMRLTVVGKEAILTTGSLQLDREQTTELTFKVVAKDGGIPTLSGTTTVTVVISDVNDNYPTFSRSQVEIYVSKDTPVNSVVYTVVAQDNDTDTLVYSLATQSSQWSISPETGRVRLAKPLVDNSTFYLTVTVSDGFKSAEQNLIIRMATSNQEKPVFNQAEYEAFIKETAGPGSLVVTVNAVDPDSNVITYSIVAGNEGNVFKIDAYTGRLTVIGVLDRETRPTYDLVVRASDHGGGNINILTAEAIVHVFILEVNEHDPLFEDGVFYKLSILENQPIGTHLIQVKATDPDGGVVIYHLEGDPLALAIDGSTGDITTRLVLDREEEEIITVNVLVFDSGDPQRTATAVLEITLLDLNDNAPQFSQSSYMIFSEPVGKGTVLGKVFAYDPDAGANGEITYTGLQDSLLAVDGVTGEIMAKNDLPPGTYDLEIRATDRGTPPLRSIVRLTVSVTQGAITPAPATGVAATSLVTTRRTTTTTSPNITGPATSSTGKTTSSAQTTTSSGLTPPATTKKPSSGSLLLACVYTLALCIVLACTFIA